MLIIPAIDLRDGRCVRLTQGRKELTKIYDGDPVEIAKSLECAGAQMLHVVDLDGAFSDPNSRNRQKLWEILRAINIPVQFGGGLRSGKDVFDVVQLGVTRAVIGTMAVQAFDSLRTLVRLFGHQRIVVGIDARNGQVMTRGWENEGGLDACEFARRVAETGVERIVYTDIQRDGTLTGPNIEETCMIASASGLNVTASGGVSSLEDLKRLKAASDCGIDSVIVGKALYEGHFIFEEAVRVVENSA